MGVRTMDLEQAQAELEALVNRAKLGEEIILTQEGEPVARIVSVASLKRSRTFGSARGKIVIHEDFDAPLDEMRDYM